MHLTSYAQSSCRRRRTFIPNMDTQLVNSIIDRCGKGSRGPLAAFIRQEKGSQPTCYTEDQREPLIPRRPLFSATQLTAAYHHCRLSPSIASPPGIPRYKPKVSFGTLENVVNMFSFMLEVKSIGCKRSRNTRLFLCAASSDESAREALD